MDNCLGSLLLPFAKLAGLIPGRDRGRPGRVTGERDKRERDQGETGERDRGRRPGRETGKETRERPGRDWGQRPGRDRRETGGSLLLPFAKLAVTARARAHTQTPKP